MSDMHNRLTATDAPLKPGDLVKENPANVVGPRLMVGLVGEVFDTGLVSFIDLDGGGDWHGNRASLLRATVQEAAAYMKRCRTTADAVCREMDAQIEQAESEALKLREWVENAQARLDGMGVPRGYAPRQNLTILGRLDWLQANVPGLAALIDAAVKKSQS